MKGFEVGDGTDKEDRPWWSVFLNSIGLVVMFVGVERAVRTLGRLPEAYYFRASLTSGVLQRLWGWPSLLLLVLIGAAAAIVLRRSDGRAVATAWVGPWRDWEHGQALRVVLAVTAGVIAWSVVSYAPNPYFGQSYVLDRVLILCGLAALVWRPAAILPFTVLVVAFIGQLDYPLADHPWTEINLVLRVLLLFAAAHLIGAIRRNPETETFILVVCCLIAVSYWWSGQGKWELGWIGHPHLNLLMLGAYANGWLQMLGPQTVVRISEAMAPFNTPLMVFTLVVEWGAVLLLFRRSTLVGFLLLAAGFHVGVFAMTGMLFWKWIALEGVLLWFLISKSRIRALRIFTPAHFAVSVLLILACRFWVEGQNLSWYDTPLTYTVRLTGIGATGASYALPTPLTAPYADMFFLAPFRYLTSDPQVTSVMGAAGQPHALADSLVEARSAEAVLAIVGRQPQTPVDSAKAERFDRLIRSIAEDLNARGVRPRGVVGLLRAPAHLWSGARRSETAYASQDPLVQVSVDVVLSYYDGTTLRDIERRRVRTIDVSGR